MQNPKVHHGGIKQTVSEWQLFGIAFAKLDAGVKPLCVRDHCGRKIDPESDRAALCRRRCDVTRAARNIDDFDSSLCARRIQQRFNSLRGQADESLMIGLGNGLPTRVFEVMESMRFNHGSLF